MVSLVGVGVGVSVVSKVMKEQSFLLLSLTPEGQQVLKFLGGDELPQHLFPRSLSGIAKPQPV